MRKKSGMKKFIVIIFLVLAATYLLLLIPEREPSLPAIDAASPQKQPFVWNQDFYWEALEAKYRQLQQSGCTDIQHQVATELIKTASPNDPT